MTEHGSSRLISYSPSSFAMQVRTAANSLTALYPVLAARVRKATQSKKSAAELHVCRPPQPITLVQRSWADVRAAQKEAESRKEEDLVALMEADVNIPVASSDEAPIDMMQVRSGAATCVPQRNWRQSARTAALL